MQGHGINLVTELVGSDYQTITTALFVSVTLVTPAVIARNSLSKIHDPVIPDEKLTIRNFFELPLTFIRNITKDIIGPGYEVYLPFITTLFIYIFFNNIVGLIPGLTMATSAFLFNFGVAITVFIGYNYLGIKKQGFKKYFGHMCGPNIFIALLLFPVEIVSHFIRPFSLSLRLFGNMTGDHLVLEVFTNLTKLFIPLAFYFMGTFVCFIQAMVFTLLTIVYIKLATEHADHDEDHGHSGH